VTLGRRALLGGLALAALPAAACQAGQDPPPVPSAAPAPSVLVQEARLTASPGQAGASFGFSLAASGNTLVVGAQQEDTAGGADAGAVYVFVRAGSSWSLQQRLTAPDGAEGDLFGISVSVSGDTAVVGADFHDTAAGADAGAAYVFVRAGTVWTLQQKITAPDAATDDRFGFLVSVSGDTLVAGSHLDDTPAGADAGSAYVFTRTGAVWTLQQKLTPADAAPDDRFGFPLSLSGDTLLAGSYRDDNTGGADAGSVYVFVRAGASWSVQQKLTASDGAADDQFGRWVSVSGDTAVVGSILDDNASGADAGSAYVYVRAGATWTQQQKLTAPDGAAADQFGRSVSVAGDTIAVGAYAHDTPAGADAGAAYVFTRSGSTWTPQWKMAAPDGGPGDLFGRTVAVVGDTVVAGAEGSDTPGGAGAGASYVFRAAPAAAYYALAPCRVVDTRAGAGALAANSTRTFAAGGLCQVPSDARAVAAILTAVNPGEAGNLRLFPTGQPLPLASSVNFAAGLTRAGNTILTLGADGRFDVRCDMPPGSAAATHFVLDVLGYFR
jgi:hypothetical protein